MEAACRSVYSAPSGEYEYRQARLDWSDPLQQRYAVELRKVQVQDDKVKLAILNTLLGGFSIVDDADNIRFGFQLLTKQVRQWYIIFHY
jgi:hypothetical protein